MNRVDKKKNFSNFFILFCERLKKNQHVYFIFRKKQKFDPFSIIRAPKIAMYWYTIKVN